MPSPYRVVQDAINELDNGSTTNTAALAWALARIVDRRVWEVRTSRWGVCVYPRQSPPPAEVLQ